MQTSSFDYLATHYEKDVFPNLVTEKREKVVYKERPTSKIIIFDKNKNVALVGNMVHSFYFLPGGGVEEGETPEQAAVRESLEEVGYRVTIINKLGVIDDYRTRDRNHNINHCFIAKIKGSKLALFLTEEEKKNGMHVVWKSLPEARSILQKEVTELKKGNVKFYNTGFNILRDFVFLNRAINLRND